MDLWYSAEAVHEVDTILEQWKLENIPFSENMRYELLNDSLKSIQQENQVIEEESEECIIKQSSSSYTLVDDDLEDDISCYSSDVCSDDESEFDEDESIEIKPFKAFETATSSNNATIQNYNIISNNSMKQLNVNNNIRYNHYKQCQSPKNASPKKKYPQIANNNFVQIHQPLPHKKQPKQQIQKRNHHRGMS
ncbi:hypothetical protein ABK040_003664 [Willaertia magna]